MGQGQARERTGSCSAAALSVRVTLRNRRLQRVCLSSPSCPSATGKSGLTFNGRKIHPLLRTDFSSPPPASDALPEALPAQPQWLGDREHPRVRARGGGERSAGGSSSLLGRATAAAKPGAPSAREKRHRPSLQPRSRHWSTLQLRETILDSSAKECPKSISFFVVDSHNLNTVKIPGFVLGFFFLVSNLVLPEGFLFHASFKNT